MQDVIRTPTTTGVYRLVFAVSQGEGPGYPPSRSPGAARHSQKAASIFSNGAGYRGEVASRRYEYSLQRFLTKYSGYVSTRHIGLNSSTYGEMLIKHRLPLNEH